MDEVGLGGSCHWCTEAIFLSVKGVIDVKQGWISSLGEATAFSEAILLRYNPEIISLKQLIAIHLHTHSCTSNHTMREKYRSAVYVTDEGQIDDVRQIISELQSDFEQPIITRALKINEFKLNKPEYLDYYYSNPSRGFCENIINPKLKVLLDKFSKLADRDKIGDI
ncbi:peptide-methionine (S)-S-oxide reductase [Pedobacter endophyticus]|uniref:peptide-methionine (S)-S-oxide reductase n=1 Tax=Pedobacter endophyticus TaxID=2789740 RepID=A0A7S9KZ52_9SPHI|nr:peptide-methionine (S)-S-oxide reductase [Pedobacter endophyticus]QPH39525.1 peptide-methionine (S)-S-oxide reductase [Pedobacter endophyticus]